MSGCRSGVLWGAPWVVTTVVLVAASMGVEGARHHDHRQLLGNSFSDLVRRVDSSILEKTQHLGHATRYHTHSREAGAEEDLTIVQEEEEETHPEDMQDYVNNAPWTRRNKQRPALSPIDMQMIRLASQNAQLVKEQGRCQVPQQRCETVSSSQHPPGTIFLPRCALLHRCADDTGCCLSDDKTCAPVETESVQLYFYAFGGSRARIEEMTFTNHTRCSCQPRSAVTAAPPPPLNCRCPRYYTAMPEDGQCVCDCDVGRSKCRRYKKGRRYFSPSDTSCISNGECTKPACDFGPFLMRHRRCTKRRERERNATHMK